MCLYPRNIKFQETKTQMPVTSCMIPIPVKNYVLWFESKKSPTGSCVSTLAPQPAALFWMLWTLHYWEQALRSTVRALLPGALGSERAAPTFHCHTGPVPSKPKLKETSPLPSSGYLVRDKKCN